jgi:hypothetical protein
VYALWLDAEEQRQVEERERLDRVIRASHPWPCPRGPHGFERQRKEQP